MLGRIPNLRAASRSVLLVVSILILLGSVGTSEASAYYSLTKESQTTVSPPPVELQEGTAENSTSTIYANGTSAKVSVEVSGTGVTDVEDYVDNNMSDIDTSTDIGTHSNFTAQKYGPDLINDTLREGNTTVNYEYIWISGSDDYVYKLNKSDPGETGILNWDTQTGYPFGCEHRIEYGNEYIYTVDYRESPQALIRYHANNGSEVIRWDISGYSTNAYGLAWNGSRWFISDGVVDLIYQVDPTDPTVQERSFTYTGIGVCEGLAWDGSYFWAVDSGTDKAYQIDIYGNIHTSWSSPANPYGVAYDASSGHLWIVDSASLLYEYYSNGTEINNWDPPGSGPRGVAYSSIDYISYQLDLEVQWTNVDYDEPYEFLCIYGRTMDAENIRVDVWHNSAWQNVFSDLSDGWNNVSVSSYLDSSNFTIRFKGGTETVDTTQDTWEIDAAILHVWAYEVLGNATTVSTNATSRAVSYGKDRAVLRTTDVNNTLHVFQIDSNDNLQWWKSTDDGTTWEKPFNSTLAVLSFSVKRDGSNYIHLVYADSNGMVTYKKQLYNATDWGASVAISSDGDSYQPDVAIAAYNNSWIYVVYDNHKSAPAHNEVWVRNSTDRGTSFGDPVELTYNEFSYTGTFPSIVIDNTLDTYGHVYVTWYRGSTYLYLRRGNITSTGAVSWDGDSKVQTVSSGMSTSVTENTNMMHSAMYANGKYRVVYCESGTAKYRDWDESSWSSPISLATVSHYPSITYDWNSYIYVFYHTDDSNPNYDIRYQRSTDNTPTGFGSAKNVTDDNNGNKYVSAKLGGDNDRVEFAWTNGTSSYSVEYNSITEREEGGLGQADFNYVLKLVEKDNSDWTVRLKAYDNSSLSRLGNCSIYIYNGFNSTQIVVLNGDYENQTGPWIDLNASDTEYIWMHVETSGGGTSYVYVYLEIRIPDTTTYIQYVITFEIT
jgi:hypothetical protein